MRDVYSCSEYMYSGSELVNINDYLANKVLYSQYVTILTIWTETLILPLLILVNVYGYVYTRT